jgi:hypothetical protein
MIDCLTYRITCKIDPHVDNQHSEKINSTQYWDRRFTDDWKENNGVEQSQFFSRLAVDNLPPWFIRYIKQEQPSFCDWGCAMGSGTKVLRDLLSIDDINGIDFSEIAITEARSNYPGINFTTADILKEQYLPQYDVIFSSNTLEHFNNPWDVTEILAQFANKFIVLLVPFQEYHRHFEHFYTFDAVNIPTTIGESHFLAYFSVSNAAGYPSSYWNGQQILLIYATYAEYGSLRLTLSDLIANRLPPQPIPQTNLLNQVHPVAEPELNIH